jgi:cyanophycinase
VSRQGILIAIGGNEDKEGERTILKQVVERLAGGRMVLATVASHQPEGYFDAYRRAFASLGIDVSDELYIGERVEALNGEKPGMLADAAGVFFSGGDQLRITSQVGNTAVERRVREILSRGGVVAGTSAGAAVMGGTMLVKGPSHESHRIGAIHLAPGLGLIRNVIIDQHFAERGRIGRLLGAIAQNPRVLGIGIDEDTAIVVEGRMFHVIGSGAVYAVDGSGVTYSNTADSAPELALSLHDVRLHVLSAGDRFDLDQKRPLRPRD